MVDEAKKRFCHYGKPAGHFVENTGTWKRRGPPGGPFQFMCPACQAVRRLPKEVLDRMTEEERNERRAESRRIALESNEERKK